MRKGVNENQDNIDWEMFCSYYTVNKHKWYLDNMESNNEYVFK